MNISIIRHAKVNFIWKKWSNSYQYVKDCKLYDQAEIINTPVYLQKQYIRCYTSTLSRSKETAEKILGYKEYIETRLINEVSLSAAFKTKNKFPPIFWNILGRIQWLYNSKNQKEGINETYKRAENFVHNIIKKGEDCIIVTHGFFMITLIKVMKKSGFKIKRNTQHYNNCQVIEAKIQDDVSRET